MWVSTQKELEGSLGNMEKSKYKIYGLKVYTKTVMESSNDGCLLPKMYGVIEGPVTKMIKAYPEEFSFMRHETKRSLRDKNKK